ncbi:hypothetical protein [Actinomadura rupiterrae]|uniref:hypothetical protein n=1 Tax=Actinomadura rupiterrae TaxID=559627 RepID=UPI0020A3F094|nr:hypothetical protein [Actinomadura rupiterrae]MCP2337182.1 hypothetical protein [Actinomadura rupiterrae]
MSDPWAEIDEHILNGRNIQAIAALRDQRGYGLAEAVDAYSERCSWLRKHKSGDFTESRMEYGDGSSSR